MKKRYTILSMLLSLFLSGCQAPTCVRYMTPVHRYPYVDYSGDSWEVQEVCQKAKT